MRSTTARIRITILLSLVCLLATVSTAIARNNSAKKNSEVTAAVQAANDNENMRVQGEQRFRANCGRCHAAPQKFPPRIMATVVRHMRVRATITDEDMRLVLFYMTQ